MNETVILVADDDTDIRNLIRIYLSNEGFRVVHAKDGLEALRILETERIDLVVLDVMMPGLDGIRTCLRMREEKGITVSVIMLSAKSEDQDKILGLFSGADDYLAKPFNPLELVARIKSQLRRVKKYDTTTPSDRENSLNASVIQIGDLIIDIAAHEVKIKGRSIKLTPREFDILVLLAKNRGKVFSMQKIYECVWETDFYAADSTIAVHIRNLREKLGVVSDTDKYIVTVWGVGYKIED